MNPFIKVRAFFPVEMTMELEPYEEGEYLVGMRRETVAGGPYGAWVYGYASVETLAPILFPETEAA